MIEDTETHRVVDEAQGNDNEQHGNGKQEERGTMEIAIEALNQILLIQDIGHEFHATKLLANPLQAVITGIFWPDLYFHRDREGIGSEEVRWVDAHALYLFLKCLLAADVFNAAHIGLGTQRVLQTLCICRQYIIVQHYSDRQVLPDAVGHDTCCERKQHHKPQEDEKQARADGAGDTLKNPGNL